MLANQPNSLTMRCFENISNGILFVDNFCTTAQCRFFNGCFSPNAIPFKQDLTPFAPDFEKASENDDNIDIIRLGDNNMRSIAS